MLTNQMNQFERRSILKRLLILFFLVPNIFSLVLFPYYSYEHSKWEKIFIRHYDEVQQRHQDNNAWCRANGIALEQCNFTVLTASLDMAQEIKGYHYAKMSETEFYFYAVPLISALLLFLGNWVLTGRIPRLDTRPNFFKKTGNNDKLSRSFAYAPIMTALGIALLLVIIWLLVPADIGVSMVVGGIMMAVLVGIHELKQRKRDRD
jgi:hypothetical protein